MTNFKKQILVYISLVFICGVCFILSLRNPDYLPDFLSSNDIPQSNTTAILFQNIFMKSDSFNFPHIIFIVLFLTAPFWLFTGYYFSKKMNLPGIYKSEKILKRDNFIMAVTCAVWGIVIPLISVLFLGASDKTSDSLIQMFFLQIGLIILLEIFIRLFQFSIVLCTLNLILKKYLAYNKIEFFSIIFNSILVIFFLYKFRLFISGKFSFEDLHFNFEAITIINLALSFLVNYLFCIIYIKNGLFLSILTRIIIFILSSVVYWIII